MSTVFSGGELINVAIGIERRGITFYDIMAKSTDSEMARAVFEELVEMEREHLKTFRDMLEQVDEHPATEVPTQEYSEYLQVLMDNAVFTDDMITGEMATQADSDIKAVELGISAEKDSLLFYYDMRDNIPRRSIPVMDRIIAEEKLHLQQLSEIKKKLAAS